MPYTQKIMQKKPQSVHFEYVTIFTGVTLKPLLYVINKLSSLWFQKNTSDKDVVKVSCDICPLSYGILSGERCISVDRLYHVMRKKDVRIELIP